MKRDYAKKKTRAYRQHSWSWLLWLVTIIFFVVFTLGLVYFGKHYQTTVPAKMSQPSVTKTNNPSPAKQSKQPKQLHFDFYTLSGRKSAKNE